MNIKTLIGWNEPDGTRHEAGEIWKEVPQDKIPDFEDLIENGTIEKFPAYRVEAGKPFKPTMETKEQE